MEKRCKVNTNCVGARGEGLFNVLCSTFKVQTDTKKERPYLSPASLEPAEYAEKDKNIVCVQNYEKAQFCPHSVISVDSKDPVKTGDWARGKSL